MGDMLRALEAAYGHAVDWVESVPNRPVAPAATAEQLLTLLNGPLPAGATDPAEVVDMLVAAAEFTTGATMANFTCLAAAGHRVLAQAGWDVEMLGLQGAPKVTVLASEDRHVSVDGAMRYLGFGSGTIANALHEASAQPSSAYRRATSTPPLPTTSPRRSRPPRNTEPGCMSMARSGCGPA